MIIRWTAVLIIVFLAFATIWKEKHYDYNFVDRCTAAGGEAVNIGDTWRCNKDGKQLLIGE